MSGVVVVVIMRGGGSNTQVVHLKWDSVLLLMLVFFAIEVFDDFKNYLYQPWLQILPMLILGDSKNFDDIKRHKIVLVNGKVSTGINCFTNKSCKLSNFILFSSCEKTLERCVAVFMFISASLQKTNMLSSHNKLEPTVCNTKI